MIKISKILGESLLIFNKHSVLRCESGGYNIDIGKLNNWGKFVFKIIKHGNHEKNNRF